MLVSDIVSLLNAEPIYLTGKKALEIDYSKCFASDLMSDALALLRNERDDVLFLTGLVNVQALRTAEVLDLQTIIFVRGKPIDESIINAAEELSINLFKTNLTMFETCGLLYEKGLSR